MACVVILLQIAMFKYFVVRVSWEALKHENQSYTLTLFHWLNMLMNKQNGVLLFLFRISLWSSIWNQQIASNCISLFVRVKFNFPIMALPHLRNLLLKKYLITSLSLLCVWDVRGRKIFGINCLWKYLIFDGAAVWPAVVQCCRCQLSTDWFIVMHVLCLVFTFIR